MNTPLAVWPHFSAQLQIKDCVGAAERMFEVCGTIRYSAACQVPPRTKSLRPAQLLYRNDACRVYSVTIAFHSTIHRHSQA